MPAMHELPTTAALNGMSWELLAGDLVEPVAGRRFDLVVSNPPFVITPRTPGMPSYEYRDGATSYGAFTYSLAKELRRSRQGRRNPSFRRLVALTTRRLQALQYEQTPSLVGPRALLGRPIPWDTRRG